MDREWRRWVADHQLADILAADGNEIGDVAQTDEIGAHFDEFGMGQGVLNIRDRADDGVECIGCSSIEFKREPSRDPDADKCIGTAGCSEPFDGRANL